MAATQRHSVEEVHELSKNSKVWVPNNEDGWISGTVLEIESGQIRVSKEDESEGTYPASALFLQNPSIMDGVEDMTTLSHLHEPAILHNLSTRYSLDYIYTYTGSILIAVNPYAKLNIYSKEMIDAYCGQPLGKLAPHVYAMAEEAYRSMVIENTNQSILVSGESGAGKTETTKFLLQYFAAMGQRERTRNNNQISKTAKEVDNIEAKVLGTTPVLEAFGNAKTLRNDNSSRFGKFIEIQFDQFGIIMGAKIRTYLLEKSRIVRQARDERNYHSFYQLVKGCPENDRQKFRLLSASDYRYLNQSGCIDVDDVSDEEQYQKTREAMSVIGITKEEQDQIFMLISAILQLGNVEFQDGSSTDSSKINNSEELQKASALLGVDAEALEKYLITKKVVAVNDSYYVPLTPEKASTTRDSLAMLLYSRMFDWLVSRINQSIQNLNQKPKSFIGVLDIYGFESFESNSFEQFCINYANEKLQQQFNQQIFKLEQKEYEKEKIDWSYIKFNDNQECLDLIEKKPICILTLLDEECKFPKSTAATFAQKLYSNFHVVGKNVHPYFEKPRFSNTQFTVRHYAGPVTYETETFLDKNKDFIVPEHISLLEKSNIAYVKNLFTNFWAAQASQNSQKPGAKTDSKTGAQFVSVGSQFRDSLTSLMESIHATSPHYIRCIKPNHSKQPHMFSQLLVLQQLRCGGVLECIRISKAGYPTRRPYDGFLKRYKLLAPDLVKAGNSMKPRDYCEALIKKLGVHANLYQFGLTKIFLRAGQLAKFEQMRTDLMNTSATAIQKVWKGILARRWYKKVRSSAIRIQSAIRMILAQRLANFIRKNRAATIIQSCVRMYAQRRKYVQVRDAVITLQAALRGKQAKNLLVAKKRVAMATIIQAASRGYMCRQKFLKLQKAVIIAQTRWRGKLARKQYKEMLVEARSLKTIVAQKTALEQKLEEIQWKFAAELKIRQRLEEDIKRSANLLKEARSSCVLESHAYLEIENKKLRAELDGLKEKFKKEEELRKAAESQAKSVTSQVVKLESELKSQKAKFNDNLVQELNLTREQSEKSQQAVKDLEIAHQQEISKILNEAKDREQKLESANKELRTKLENSERAQADLKKKIANMERDHSPEHLLKVRAKEVMSGNENNAAKFLVDFAVSKVLTRLQDKPEAAFCSGIPLPAFIVTRSILPHDKEELDESLLAHIAESMNTMTRNYRDDITTLSFWLSNAAVLLHSLVPTEAQNELIFNMPTIQAGLKATEAPSQDGLTQLKSIFIRIFSMLVDHIMRNIKPLAYAALETGENGKKATKNIVTYLGSTLNVLQQNFLHMPLVTQIFAHVYQFLGATFFNEIILRRDLCTWTQGMETKMKIAAIEDWSKKPGTREWVASSSKELETVKELISLILLMDKSILSNKSVRQEVCPSISALQIKQLLSMYQPDEALEEPIPIPLLQAIFKSDDFHPEDPLCLDANKFLNFPISNLHHLDLSDIRGIPFPANIQREFDAATMSPKTPKIHRKSVESATMAFGRNSITPIDEIQPNSTAPAKLGHKRSVSSSAAGDNNRVVTPAANNVTPVQKPADLPPAKPRSGKDTKSKGMFSFWK